MFLGDKRYLTSELRYNKSGRRDFLTTFPYINAFNLSYRITDPLTYAIISYLEYPDLAINALYVIPCSCF